jgi:hypothetical protein
LIHFQIELKVTLSFSPGQKTLFWLKKAFLKGAQVQGNPPELPRFFDTLEYRRKIVLGDKRQVTRCPALRAMVEVEPSRSVQKKNSNIKNLNVQHTAIIEINTNNKNIV